MPHESQPSGGAEHSSKAPIKFNSDESPKISNRDRDHSRII